MLPRRILLFVLLTTGAWTLGCGGGGAGSVAQPTPPPPSIQIEVSPQSGTVLLGETLRLAATVSNSTNTGVSWSVEGISGGSPQVGLISVDGVYTAPADLPQGGTVQVIATSNADSSKFATVSISITSDISVSLMPGSVSISLGGAQSFRASVSSNGHPDNTVRWSVSGLSCPSACGSIDSNGNYTAPSILPNPPLVTITATSVADSAKQASAAISVASNFNLQLTGPSTLQSGVTAALIATLTPTANSKPSGVLSWSLSGPGCSAGACGILKVVTTESSGTAEVNDTASYTAPSSVPQPNSVTITVTPLADPSKKAQAVILIQSAAAGALNLSPDVTTLAANHRATLIVTGSGSSGGTFNWSVNGISGGNASTGTICVHSSNTCQALVSGTATLADFLAPGAIPSSNPVSISVINSSSPGLTASTQITVMNHILVSVTPNNLTLLPLATQNLTASVLGSDDQNVIWQIQGSGCSLSGACGSIDSFGTYRAPAAPPSPASFQIVAVSEDDSSQSGVAAVSISNALNIATMRPSSVYAGAANGFTLLVNGSGFVPSNPGPGSTLVVGGAARFTTCTSANTCSAPLSSADVAAAGNVSAQIENPDKTLSNIVQLKVVAPSSTESVITLTSGSPASKGNDITVVDLTTAGIDASEANFDLDVAAIGAFVTSTNSCSLAGNPIPLQRPSTGTTAADVCLFSSAGFDTSMSYIVSGPGDVTVISKQPAGLGIIHLTLQIPASAAPGSRTLFIQNANLDRTAATGVLEVR